MWCVFRRGRKRLLCDHERASILTFACPKQSLVLADAPRFSVVKLRIAFGGGDSHLQELTGLGWVFILYGPP